MKIAILYDTAEGREEYPGDQYRGGRKRKRLTDREAIAAALRELGHEPFEIAVDGKVSTLQKIAKSDADLFFNLVESYGGDDTKEMHFAAYLDLVGKRYTGAGPEASYLAMDKPTAKKIVRFHDLYTPYSAVIHKGRVDHAQDIRFPLIVKPASEDASKGIDSGSVVNSIKELMERIEYLDQEFDSPALIEEYVEGREIYAAILGNDRPEVLPPIELDLSALPKGERIASHEVKFDESSDLYKKTKSAPAKNLGEELTAAIAQAAITTFRALKMRDYARIDLRVTKEDRIYVIEANPNPWLDPAAELAMAAKESGRSYVELIETIVKSAMARGPAAAS
jgi:D-alanine-D-alanine ligase